MNVVFLHRSQLKTGTASRAQKEIRNGRLPLQRPDVLSPRNSRRSEAAGDVFAVEQIINVNRNAGARHTKTRQIVLDDRIHHRCAAYLEAIGRIAVTGTNKTTACSQR